MAATATAQLSIHLSHRLSITGVARSLVRSQPLTGKFYEALGALEGDDDKVTYALEQMEEYDFENVRHVEAFCTGICRRVAKHGTDGVNLGVLGEEMKEILERLISEGKFAREDLDFRVVSNLEKLSEADRKLAVQRYEDKLDDTINSKQGYDIITALGCLLVIDLLSRFPLQFPDGHCQQDVAWQSQQVPGRPRETPR